ncbi:MAG: DUF4395 domain-containing protein [Pseudomonadota bacterium]
MAAILRFGEPRDGFDVPVLDEREVRAGAGILFLLALVAFMNSWLVGDFHYTRVFVVAFLVDFVIRVALNPRFSPTLILGRLAVRHQAPEWTGAPQKRFAWGIGLALAATMFYLIVLNEVVGPVNLFICLFCLLLLFFESAFGICIGCKIYELAFRKSARHCPGGVCPADPVPAKKVSAGETAILVAFMAFVLLLGQHLPARSQQPAARADAAPAAAVVDDKCTPPDWAVQMGHAEKWKLHNNCK